MIDTFHAPNGQMLIGSIENCPNQSTQTAHNHKQPQFPNRKVRRLSRENVEFPKGKELVNIGLALGKG
jgi:hypothetical protein